MKIKFSIEYRTVWGENLFIHYGKDRKAAMQYAGDGIWSTVIEAESEAEFGSYHYEVEEYGRFKRREWMQHSLESGEKRTGNTPPDEAYAEIRDKWQMMPRCAGTAVPVFSLRSENGFGTGEFNDLKLLTDWAAATGQKIIQLLPVNDTTMTGTWTDSYPYSAVSIYALHPQFIHLPDAGVEEDEEYNTLKNTLNALPAVDYEKVNAEKDRLLRKAFASRWRSTCMSGEYRRFFRENSFWLLPYAAFRILQKKYGTSDFNRWGEYKAYDPTKTGALLKKEKQECNYFCFVQFHLHRQLSMARDYAHSHGVYLKGDLPIGISPESADAWTSPELFHLDSQAGAPPDAFAAKGQNWGLPTYNWDRMSRDGYAWWKSRMKNMEQYFDAFRIDHILGFFRIWEIPLGAKSGLLGHFSPALPYSAAYLKGLGFSLPDSGSAIPESEDVLFVADPYAEGYWHPRIAARDTDAYMALDQPMKDTYNRLYDDFFYHRHNGFWKESAMKKLPELLSSTQMLACGEDLGMIPACVPDVMKDLCILSLEIQRMPKLAGETFADVGRYPYMSVCSTSTHDMNPLRAWWKEDGKLSQKFFNEVLGKCGHAPQECEAWICRDIVKMHLDSPSLLAILPLQDWLSTDEELRNPDADSERINDPAEAPHYWRYRMHLTLEKLLEAVESNRRLHDMISAAGR